MPIRADLRKFYGHKWRTVTRPRILNRAGNKCEQCRVPNHTDVWRARGPWWRLTTVGAVWHRGNGNTTTFEPSFRRPVHIVLAVVHLNHTAGQDGDDNLRALCQWCHLNYDQAHHRETRATRKDRARPLLSMDLADLQALRS